MTTAPDDARGRRLLILAPFPPGGQPPHGGSVAIGQLVRALSRRHRVALAYLRAADEPSVDAELARGCDATFESPRLGLSVSSIRPLRRIPRILAAMYGGDPLWVASRRSPAFAALLDDVIRSWRPDVVQAEFSVMGAYLLSLSTPAKTVVTFHDVGHRSRRWRRFDRRLLDRIDTGVAFTTRDAAALAALGGRAPVEVIPLGVSVAPAERRAAEPVDPAASLLLFVGNFIHPPNLDAARYLVESVLPLVRQAHPAAQLAIVGDHAPGWLFNREHDGVRALGVVPDLEPLMNAAAVVVAPLREGGGMRVKVLEALAAGKAVVGTTLAFEGTNVVPGRDAVVADDTPAFAGAIAQLLDDPGRRRALGESARLHVLTALSWDRTIREYEAVYDRLLTPEPPR